jgi:hypothetical protein
MGLRIDRLSHLLVAMAHAHGQNAAEKIQKLLAVAVIDVLISGMIDDQRLIVVSRHAGKEIFFFACR